MIKGLLRHLNILNILLIGILVILARYALYPVPEPKIIVKPTSQQAGIGDDSAEKEVPSSSPADYMIIAEQNPFHPERKIPVEKKAEQPLPKPEFVLYGTLITDDLSIAYMEDKKAPVSTPGRGNRQTPLRVGQSLSGFTLKEIETEKVVMVRGEETMTVYLNDPNVPKQRTTAIAVPAKQGATPAPPQQRQTTSTPQPGRTRVVEPRAPEASASDISKNARKLREEFLEKRKKEREEKSLRFQRVPTENRESQTPPTPLSNTPDSLF
ncbi:MAG: hypothetical protein ACK415_06875 [Thermodesulfovibrionales bacterium]